MSKSKVRRLWGIVAKDDGWLLCIDHDDGFPGALMAVYKTRKGARDDLNEGERVARVEVREIHSAPKRVRRGVK